jgi:hypothetical protein
MVRGSNTGWGDILLIRPDRPWVPPNGYWVFPGDKTAGEWPWPPTTSNAEVKERVEQYIYSFSLPLWPVLWWTVPLLSSTFNLKTEWSQDKSSHIRVQYVLSRIKFLFIVLVSVTTYSCAQKWNKNNLAAFLSSRVFYLKITAWVLLKYKIELTILEATTVIYFQLPRVGNNSTAKAGTWKVCDRVVCYTIQVTIEEK